MLGGTGLEPQIKRMVEDHKQQLERARSDTLTNSDTKDQALVAAHARELDQTRQDAEKGKIEAVERERELQRYAGPQIVLAFQPPCLFNGMVSRHRCCLPYTHRTSLHHVSYHTNTMPLCPYHTVQHCTTFPFMR